MPHPDNLRMRLILSFINVPTCFDEHPRPGASACPEAPANQSTLGAKRETRRDSDDHARGSKHDSDRAALNSILLTDVGELFGFCEPGHNGFSAGALAEFAQPVLHTASFRLTAHEGAVESRQELGVIRLQVHELFQSEEELRRICAGLLKIGESQRPVLQSAFFRLTAEAAGVKTCRKSDRILRCKLCLGSRRSGTYSVGRADIAPFLVWTCAYSSAHLPRRTYLPFRNHGRRMCGKESQQNRRRSNHGSGIPVLQSGRNAHSRHRFCYHSQSH